MLFRRLSLRDVGNHGRMMFWNLVAVNYERYNLHHIMLFAFLLAYSLLGAYLFVLLEAENERATNEEAAVKLLRQSISAKNDFVETVQNLYFQLAKNSEFYETQLRKALADYDQAMGVARAPEFVQRWDLWGGLYYAGTIYTTIGYGDLAATTFAGRLFTMLYAVVGIPMVITILNDWGTVLFHAVNSLWHNYVLKLVAWVKRQIKEKAKKRSGSSEEGLYQKDDTTDDEDDAPKPIPLFLVVVVLVFWVCICTVVFAFLEDWSYFESVYFFFVSMTTIGFGDLAPDHKVAVANFLLILIGLSIVSMSINVVQMQLEIIFVRIVKRIEIDFKNNLSVGANDRKKSIGTNSNCDIEKSKKQPMTKEGDVTDKYTESMGGADRILMRFMSNHQRKMLNDKFEERAKMRNRQTQTFTNIKVASVQTVERFEPQWEDIEEDEQPNQKSRINTRRLYIYNTGE